MDGFCLSHCSLSNWDERLHELPERLHPEEEDHRIDSCIDGHKIDIRQVPYIPPHKRLLHRINCVVVRPQIVVIDDNMGVETVIHKDWHVAY